MVALKGYYESEGKRMNDFIDIGFGGLVRLTEIRDEEVEEHNEKKDRLEVACQAALDKWYQESQPDRERLFGVF